MSAVLFEWVSKIRHILKIRFPTSIDKIQSLCTRTPYFDMSHSHFVLRPSIFPAGIYVEEWVLEIPSYRILEELRGSIPIPELQLKLDFNYNLVHSGEVLASSMIFPYAILRWFSFSMTPDVQVVPSSTLVKIATIEHLNYGISKNTHPRRTYGLVTVCFTSSWLVTFHLGAPPTILT